MPRLFRTYWYRTEPSVARAGLYNLRDDDLQFGGNIRAGEIIVGLCGFAIAEANVPKLTGRAVPYSPNRCVEWQGFYLTCMALANLPAQSFSRRMISSLRHRHYVVAELSSLASISRAKMLRLSFLRDDESRTLVNLELVRIPGRTPLYRYARLL